VLVEKKKDEIDLPIVIVWTLLENHEDNVRLRILVKSIIKMSDNLTAKDKVMTAINT